MGGDGALGLTININCQYQGRKLLGNRNWPVLSDEQMSNG